MTRNLQRRSFLQGFSVTSAIALTCTTQWTAQHKRRCPTPRHTPLTTAVKEKSVPTATSARSSVTGPTLVTTTRPFNGRATPACPISTFAHVRRQSVVFWGCCFFYLRVIVWCLYCPRQSFQMEECFCFSPRICYLKRHLTVFVKDCGEKTGEWEDGVHRLMFTLLELRWSCLRSCNLITITKSLHSRWGECKDDMILWSKLLINGEL